MTLVVSLWVFTAILEVLLYTVPPIWRSMLSRRFIALLIVPLLAGALSGLVWLAPSFWSIGIAFIGLYRIVNVLRIAEGRSSSQHLIRVAPRTSAVLFGAQIVLALSWYVTAQFSIPAATAFLILASLQLFIAVVVLASASRQLKHTRAVERGKTLYLEDAPSVTIAIPARNETRDLEACLQSVTKSTYPKLEILVLDDCSQFRRTPEIIKEFAHAGVRFVKGDSPHDGWLAKNQAYAKLTREASGSLILYCGVDVRMKPETITLLVQELLSKQKRMLCVLPLREWRGGAQFAVIQAARYGWELCLPRRLFNRPPVLSSFWLAYKSDIKKYGGFAAVSRAITPEAYFARRSIVGDGYSFMRSSEELGVRSAKSPVAQRATAVRTRYPSLRRRPEMVALVAAFQLTVLLGSVVVAALAIGGVTPPLSGVLAALAASLQLLAYLMITRASGTVSWYLVPFAAPLSVIADFALMHLSMWRYEFSEVVWKDRNVCLPVMRVEKHLPKF